MARHLLILFILGFYTSTAQAGLTNQLKNHLSPYLAMHANDPVQWQEWNAATVARAKQEGKLLFVSSGYFSCHWCHVMQRESFQNKAIADLLNKHFIPVKVDREIHAALDARLIDFLERTQKYSGWPLNVFVTPEGYPLVGMVYLPSDAFQNVLSKLNSEWQQKKTELQTLAINASKELSQVQMARDTNIPKWLGPDLSNKVISQALELADEMSGGFGDQNKFPSVPQLHVLLDLYQQKRDQRIGKFLNLTLQQMASQGLRDHLAGGFFRYSVDPGWQVPHFEKMLYDNALLAGLYLDAATVFKSKAYQQIGLETLDFVLHGMATGHGTYAASLSAVDDKGIEGGYYLWQTDELKKFLDKREMNVANLVWQLEGSPDLDHGQHIVVATDNTLAAEILKLKPAQIKSYLASAKTKLLQERQKRQLPADHKRIASWNGLLLSALSKAITLSRNNHYQQAGERLQQELRQLFWDGKQLYRTAGGQRVYGQGGLEDYAFVSRGLYDWYVQTGDKAVAADLQAILKQAWQRFYGKNGWQQAENMLLRYGDGEAVILDGPMPSPAAILIEVTLKASRRISIPQLKHQAELALNSGHTAMLEAPFWYASQVHILARYLAGRY